MSDLVAYPIIEQLEYRQNIDSKQLNRMFKSLEESVLRCILRSSELNEKFDSLSLGVNSSYQALSQYMVQMGYKNITDLYATSFDNINIISGINQNKLAGIITLDWDKNKKYSKIPRYDADNDGISETVSPNVTILVDGVEREKEDSVYNILSKKKNSFWIEQIADNQTDITHTLEIQLPPSINKSLNYIEIVPFPIFGIHINKVEYFDIYSQLQTIYDSTAKNYKFYNSSGPMIFHFSPKDYNNTIKITYSVDSSLGVMGFSNIDISLIDYIDTPNKVDLIYENIPEGTTSLNISTFDLDIYVDDDNISKYVTSVRLVDLDDRDSSSHYILLDNKTISQQVNETISLTNGRMGLEITFQENFMTTPVIRGSKITYGA